MKVCVFGAGAIGGYLAAHLAQVEGLSVSVVARGRHLAAIQADGLTVESPLRTLRARVVATDNTQQLGEQDIVILTLKSHQVDAALESVTPLLGPNTAILPPTTGIPYWYFHGLSGPHNGLQIDRLDPQGRQWCHMAPARVIGCAFWVAAEVIAPGVIHHDGSLSQLPLGEPDGSRSERVVRFAAAMRAAGLDAPIVADIRAAIWAKMISSLCWNPIATLTLATQAQMNTRPELVTIVRNMMTEADEVARRLGVREMTMSIDRRIDAARASGNHKMSMLQDLERNRPLEIDVLVDSYESMRDLAGCTTPTIDLIYTLLKTRIETVTRLCS